MTKIIDGKSLADKVKKEIARSIYALNGPRPNLAIILVGERKDSELYVSLKEKEGKAVGIDTHLYKLESDIPEKELLQVIDFLNSDPLVDGILVQLPLPKEFNTDRVIAAIDPEKDVDGFHPQHSDYVLSPVLAAVKACLEEIHFDPAGKSACVLYNSEVFGQSVKDLLKPLGLQVYLKQHPEEADLLVTALGEPEKIKANQIKDGAVLIDIGIAKAGSKVLGDVDFKDVQGKASFITPVPGGIGPMTIAFLFKNVWEIYRRRHKLV